MDAHTVIETWDESSFDDGFSELNELRSRRFSGAVETDDTWLFFRDGDPLAVVESLSDAPSPGTIETFETATGTVHEASNPETASLAAMLALGGEVRGEYFTDDTPLSTVHETLSGGGFTGYVELAENVLSGDYYVVYRDGSAEYLAYVGPSSRLLTGDDAQRKAEGEVGIYSVAAVRLPSIDLPALDTHAASDSEQVGDDSSDSAADSTDSDDGAVGASTAALGEDERPYDAKSKDQHFEAQDSGAKDSEETRPDASVTNSVTDNAKARSEASEASNTDGPTPSDDEVGADDEANETTDSAAETDTGAAEGGGDTDETDDSVGSGDGVAAETDSEAVEGGQATMDDRLHPIGEPPAKDGPVVGGTTGSSTDGIENVTTRTVPSLDPDNSGRGQATEDDRDSTSASEELEAPTIDVGIDDEVEEGSPTEPAESVAVEREPSASDRTEAERELEALRAELEALRAELEPLRTERDRLRERVEMFESSESVTETNGRSISAEEALAGTSLFVREATRGAATLDDAYAGTADRESVAENLRIEYHTRFDETGATVDGEPFERYLRGSLPYRFVEWLVTDVLFEIRSTGSESGMRHLYDAIPEIDRIGFSETIPVGHGKDGRELSFDVVARDRMGEPLVVANLDASREPTYSEWMQPLIADASDVGEEHESLGAVFGVTASFFDPDALETVREATSGSLLSRDKHRSYVKLARKNGYHLCLVEARDGTYHLTVPEL